MASLTKECLQRYFQGRNVYIVGKGPSLDALTSECITNPRSPVIGINEAIHAVEELDIPNPTFLVQQDIRLRQTCQPKHSIALCSAHSRVVTKNFDNVFFYAPGRYGCKDHTLSVLIAIAIVRSCGASALSLVSFDACTHLDTGYAERIGTDPAAVGSVRRFLNHRKRIIQAAGKLSITWITPKKPQP